MRFLTTLRSRLFFLVLLSIIPSFFAVLWLTEREREHAIAVTRNYIHGTSQEISRAYEQRIETTRELLESIHIATSPTPADTGACSNRLTNLARSAPRYLANLGIVTRAGEHVCSALPMTAPFNISERLSFRRALETRKFSVGSFTRSRIDGRPILGMALPVLDGDGEIRYFNYATLDLSWLNQQWVKSAVTESHLPDGSDLFIVDENNTVLVAFPETGDWLGTSPAFLGDLQSRGGDPLFEGRGPDGSLRLFSKKRLAVGNHEFATLIVGVPLQSVLADADRNRLHWLLIMGINAVFLLLIAVVFGEFGIMRRLQPVFSSLAALSRGEDPPRNEPLHALHELGQLAVAVDNLADQVRRRELEKDAFAKSLQQSEERYRSLYKQTPAMLHSIDREGRLLHVSNHWLEKLGYARDEVIGHKSVEFLTESSRKRGVEEVLPEFFRTGKCTDVPYQMVTKSGAVLDVLLSAIAVYDEHGKVAYSLASMVDVTEKLGAEKILRQTNDLLNAVFLNAPFIILVLDGCARVIRTNLPASRLQPSGEDQTANLAWLCGQILGCAHPEEEKVACGDGVACRSCPIREGIGEAMAAGAIVRDREVAMQLMVNGTHSDRIFLMSAIPLQAFEEQTVLVTLNDISGLKQAEAAHLEMERQVLHTQKLESLGLMAGSIAHDFNNLLMAILGHLDLLDSQLLPESTLRPHLAQARRATRQAAELTSQLLTYAGKGNVRRVPVSLEELIEANAGLLQVLLSKKVILHREIADGLPLLMADPGQLQQIIMNLVTNASEAIGDNPGTILLRASIRHLDDTQLKDSRLPPPDAGEFVILEVADSGCGMDETTQQRLFDPFYSTKQSGRGLGMSALLGIVRNLHGAIFIDSTPGDGTTIRLAFPAEGSGEPGHVALPPEEADDWVGRRFYGTMLIIEDEEMVRLVTAEYAQMFGFEVLTAADGEEGVRLFCQHADRIACTLLDLTMPRMDGLETFRRIRQVRANARVILASGYVEEEISEKFTGEGLSAFLQKPYDKFELRQKLAEVFREMPSNG